MMDGGGSNKVADTDGKSSKRDWQNFRPIKKRAAHLLDNPEDIPYDVSFPWEKKKSRRSRHIGSPAFHAMLYGPLKEKGKLVPVTDVTCDAFSNILRYMYSDDLTALSMENVMDTLYAAKKYLIPELCHACRLYAQENMHPLPSPLDACKVYSQAVNIDEEKILALALGLMCSCTDIIIQSTKSLDLDQNIMQTLFSQTDISCTELQLYGLLYKWAVQRMNGVTNGAMLRQKMGDLLNLVRFPLFTLPELVNGPMEHGTLLESEIANLVHWMHADKKRENAFTTDKRGEARQKPYIATINVYSAHSAALFLDVQIELRADIAPNDCSSLRQLLEGKWDTCIQFMTSSVEIMPCIKGGQKFPEAWQDAGLSFSPGVLWINAGEGIQDIRILDNESAVQGDWTNDGICARIVNWNKLKNLIKGPFAESLEYQLVGYSERFPVGNTANEEMPG